MTAPFSGDYDGDAYAHGVLAVDATTAVGLAAITRDADLCDGDAGRPAVAAVVSVETQAARYRIDGGTPTATTGHPVPAGATIIVAGSGNVTRFRIIGQAASASITATVTRA